MACLFPAQRLGIPEPLAEAYADRIDWHEVIGLARLSTAALPPHRPLPPRQEEGPVTTGANWRNDAACLHADPDMFFPIGTTGPALDQIDEAKRICQACPVKKQCLAWALNLGAASGIWGGITETNGAPCPERPPAITIARARRGGLKPEDRSVLQTEPEREPAVHAGTRQGTPARTASSPADATTPTKFLAWAAGEKELKFYSDGNTSAPTTSTKSCSTRSTGPPVTCAPEALEPGTRRSPRALPHLAEMTVPMADLCATWGDPA